MINFCSYFDKNYLGKFLVLRDSLINLNCRHNFYVLALDDFTHDFLSKKNFSNVFVHHLTHLEKKYSDLKKVKYTRSIIEYLGQLVSGLVCVFLISVLNVARAYFLFCLRSSAYIPFYHTAFHFWAVICFKLNVALLIIYYFIVVQSVTAAILLLCMVRGGLRSEEAYTYFNLFSALCLPVFPLVVYTVYLELFKFDWEYGINRFIGSKGSESVDIQEETSSPTSISSSSSYFFSLLLLLVYVLQLCRSIKTITDTIISTKKAEVKQVEVHHMVTPYYQSVPLTI